MWPQDGRSDVGPVSPISVALLAQEVRLNKDMTDAAHKRVRSDLTQGFNEVNADVEGLRASQQQDHALIVTLSATGERRKELSGLHAVIIASVIAGVFRLLEVIITMGSHLGKP